MSAVVRQQPSRLLGWMWEPFGLDVGDPGDMLFSIRDIIPSLRTPNTVVFQRQANWIPKLIVTDRLGVCLVACATSHPPCALQHADWCQIFPILLSLLPTSQMPSSHRAPGPGGRGGSGTLIFYCCSWCRCCR